LVIFLLLLEELHLLVMVALLQLVLLSYQCLMLAMVLCFVWAQHLTGLLCLISILW
jgi:hypothetical protein